MIQRAKDLIQSPKKYDKITSAGSAAYVLNIAFDKNTGEIVDGKTLELNLEKIEEEKKYDGYYSIVTSELNMSNLEIREVYRGLINTCFTALVLIRLLQTKLENKYPVGKIINALKSYCCVPLDANTYQLTYYDKILDSCSKVLHKISAVAPYREIIVSQCL